MEDLSPEQIIAIGQKYFPEMDAQKIMDIFEQFKSLMPDSTNLEVVQTIKMTIDERKGTPKLDNLRELFKNR